MIPSIETIIEDLLAGKLAKQHAIGWLHQHAEGTTPELRDYFAGAALQSLLLTSTGSHEVAQSAYDYADSMMEARTK